MDSEKIQYQYAEIKKRYPDTILFFSVGKRIHVFGEDIAPVQKVIGLTVSDFDRSLLDCFLPKFVRAGYRVALCEQMEDDKLQSGDAITETVADKKGQFQLF